MESSVYLQIIRDSPSSRTNGKEIDKEERHGVRFFKLTTFPTNHLKYVISTHAEHCTTNSFEQIQISIRLPREGFYPFTTTSNSFDTIKVKGLAHIHVI